jgi:hypothetical protein
MSMKIYNIIKPLRDALKHLALAVAALGLSLPAARAAEITVVNSGFESGAGANDWPGWSVPGGWGRLDGSAGQYAGLIPTDGQYGIYANSPGTTSQTLTNTLQPNTIYTLSVDVGRRSDLDAQAYSISLYAGTTLLASTAGAANSLNPGWITATATYISPGSVTSDHDLYGSGIDQWRQYPQHRVWHWQTVCRPNLG